MYIVELTYNKYGTTMDTARVSKQYLYLQFMNIYLQIFCI